MSVLSGRPLSEKTRLYQYVKPFKPSLRKIFCWKSLQKLIPFIIMLHMILYNMRYNGKSTAKMLNSANWDFNVNVNDIPFFSELPFFWSWSHRTQAEQNADHSLENLNFDLELFWREKDRDVKICRLHNACIDRNGTILMHQGLSRHSNLFKNCGITKFSFFPSSADFYNFGSLSNLELIGSIPARYHIPHFLTDVLLAIYAADLIWPLTSHPSSRYTCMSPITRKCIVRNRERRVLRTALFVEDRARLIKKNEWVPKFASMMIGSPRLTSLESLFQNEHRNQLCFQTIVSFDQTRYNLKDTEWFDSATRFSKENKLSRDISFQEDLQNKTISLQHQTCVVNILILDRRKEQRRSLLDVNELKSRLSSAMENAFNNATVKKAISVAYFEKASFEEQIKQMQRADVILGVHGAGLANIFFSKKRSFLLEIFPFTYYAGPFKSIASSLFINYRSIVAEPDSNSYVECLNNLSKKYKLRDLAKRGLIVWEKALAMKETSKQLNLFEYKDTMVGHFRKCARSQQLKVDLDKVSDETIKMTREFCAGLKTVV